MRLLWFIVGLNAVLIFVGRGSFFHGIFALCLAFYVGVPAAIIALIIFIRSGQRPELHRAAVVAGGIALVAGSALLSLPFGFQIAERDIRAAEMYCEALIPKLDAYRREHGRYPARLEELHLSGDRPALVRSLSYSSNGATFHFSFVDPTGLMNSRELDSAERQWVDGD